MTKESNLADTFVNLYKSGSRIEVSFTKANGDLRKMIVERDNMMEENVKGTCNKHKSENVKRVIEVLADGSKQWRSVPLNCLISIQPLLIKNL